MSPSSSPVFVALDTADPEKAKAVAHALGPEVGGIKVGKEFFTSLGPGAVRQAIGELPLFLDLKFHDIPNTVAGAVRAAAALRPSLLTLHASGGRAMMRAAADAARQAAEKTGHAPAKLLGVTLLTSLGESDLKELGFRDEAPDIVVRWAKLAQDSGLDGVVCSPKEIAAIRAACGQDFHLVVPGIRPAGAASGDQKRVMTPRQALDAGADVLVIGRPITEAADPLAAARAINRELGLAG